MGNSVDHPDYYNWHPSGVECIDIVEEFSFNIGNAIKYLWRWSSKGGIEDLKKAIWYINREIGKYNRAELLSESIRGDDSDTT